MKFDQMPTDTVVPGVPLYVVPNGLAKGPITAAVVSEVTHGC